MITIKNNGNGKPVDESIIPDWVNYDRFINGDEIFLFETREEFLLWSQKYIPEKLNQYISSMNKAFVIQ